MNRKVINIAVTEYYVSSIVHKEISSLHSIDLNALKDAWEEVEDEIEDLYFEGRRAAFVQNKMQNTVLRDLTLLYTYSIGVREGVVQDCAKKELLDDLREQYLYFYNNLFIQGTALKILCNYRRDQSEVEVILLKAIKDLKEIEEFDNVPTARYACEVIGVLTDLLEDPEMAHIAKDLLSQNLCKFLTKIVRDISKRRRLPKPAAFDFAKYTHLDNSALRAANEAMVNDTFDEVDVVLESYHKELVMNLQKDCLKTIKVVICKWLNFEHEPELSSKIFDTILSIDCEKNDTNANETSTEDDYSKREIEGPILDLCLKALPFFTHLNVDDLPNVNLLIKKVQKLHSIFKEEGDFKQEPEEFSTKEGIKKSGGKDKQEILYYDYIYTIYNLILLLVKVNQLSNIREETDKEAVHTLHLFVSTVYQCITEACKYSIFAMQVSSFNFDLLSLGWENKHCNELHYLLLKSIHEKSNSRKLNLDSCQKIRKIITKLAHLIPDEGLRDGHCKGSEKEVNQIIYGVDRNCYKGTEKSLEFSVSLCNRNKFSNSEYFRAKKLIEEETAELDLVNIQVDDSSLMKWCGLDESSSKVIDTFINEFLEVMEEDNSKEKLKAVRTFQIFIYKLIETLSKLEISFETQKYAFYVLKMIYLIINNDELMSNDEIKEMFYTETAFTSIFSLIIRKYDYFECAQSSRQYAYLLLLRIFRLDVNQARKSFKIWSSQSNNKVSLFKRIKDLVNEFSVYFGDTELCGNTEIFDINDTDYKELILCIKWMELLCKNSEKWQNYLSLQAKLIPNQNIISSIIELMRRCLTKTHHNYIIDLLFVIVRFIIENINGHNEERIKEYTGSRIFQYSSEIIQRSLQRLENNFFTKNFIKEDADDSSDEEEDYTSQYVIDRSKKIKGKSIFTDNYRFQILVENVLIMVNSMIIPETSHMFIKEENKNLINDLMKLNYMQFYILKYDRYSLELLKKDSHLAKMYNINVGFQCIYLISKLFDNNGVEGHNYVQRIDKESLLYYYLRLGRGMLFDLNPCKSRYTLKDEKDYNEYKNGEEMLNSATKFFDGHSSNIEIVLGNGDSVQKCFPILPCFLPFTQTEKDAFWIDANLDNSKTCVTTFIGFASDKIDELFAQERVQNSFISFRDVTKKGNWLTDLVCGMILILNFFLFFSLEINDGKITKNPNMFGIGKDATGIILWFLGFGIMILMVYLFILQSWIMCILQDKRKDKWYTQSYKDGPIKSVIKLVYYIWKNTEETLHSRNMWCYIVCIGFSLGGLLNDFFWFAFTMTYLVIFSPQIMEVTRAVWMPRKRIVSTVILSTIILYWFAIIGYVYFGKDFDEVVKGSNLNMRRTLIVIFDSWYKFGLGGFLADNGRPAIQDEEENYSIRESRIAFDFLFFFIVPTLLLSIISGIIIDNFVERRANSDTIAERQNDQCFICGRKANEIADFSQHTKFEHNIWDYMFYIGYLKSMKAEDLQDYTDIHVRKCLDDENNDWFPAYQDFVIEKHQLALKAKKEKRLMHSGLSSKDATTMTNLG